jgi:pimeloyl-ACP methyl ester carboxylesterase
MKRFSSVPFVAFLLLVTLSPLCHAAPSPTPAWAPEKPFLKVATLLLTWHDPARDRDIPVKIYYPANVKTACPMIIFSHGLGGSREGYGYLGQYWAGCGYISVHLQHLGSDDSVWKGAGLDAFAQLKQSVADPLNALNRAEDVPFAIDRMLALSHQTTGAGYNPLRGLVNENEIGMAGHSFGAWTTLALVGEKTTPPHTFTDPRIKAAIAMSAPVPGGAAKAAGQFSAIAVPVFHMTGTRDDSPIGETKAAERRIPFDQATTPGTCLLILNGADHMTFSGHIFGAFRQDDAHYQSIILPASIAFWDATLRGNQAARDWLYHGGFSTLLGNQGAFEVR